MMQAPTRAGRGRAHSRVAIMFLIALILTGDIESASMRYMNLKENDSRFAGAFGGNDTASREFAREYDASGQGRATAETISQVAGSGTQEAPFLSRSPLDLPDVDTESVGNHEALAKPISASAIGAMRARSQADGQKSMQFDQADSPADSHRNIVAQSGQEESGKLIQLSVVEDRKKPNVYAVKSEESETENSGDIANPESKILEDDLVPEGNCKSGYEWECFGTVSDGRPADTALTWANALRIGSEGVEESVGLVALADAVIPNYHDLETSVQERAFKAALHFFVGGEAASKISTNSGKYSATPECKKGEEGDKKSSDPDANPDETNKGRSDSDANPDEINKGRPDSDAKPPPKKGGYCKEAMAESAAYDFCFEPDYGPQTEQQEPGQKLDNHDCCEQPACKKNQCLRYKGNKDIDLEGVLDTYALILRYFAVGFIQQNNFFSSIENLVEGTSETITPKVFNEICDAKTEREWGKAVGDHFVCRAWLMATKKDEKTNTVIVSKNDEKFLLAAKLLAANHEGGRDESLFSIVDFFVGSTAAVHDALGVADRSFLMHLVTALITFVVDILLAWVVLRYSSDHDDVLFPQHCPSGVIQVAGVDVAHDKMLDGEIFLVGEQEEADDLYSRGGVTVNYGDAYIKWRKGESTFRVKTALKGDAKHLPCKGLRLACTSGNVYVVKSLSDFVLPQECRARAYYLPVDYAKISQETIDDYKSLQQPIMVEGEIDSVVKKIASYVKLDMTCKKLDDVGNSHFRRRNMLLPKPNMNITEDATKTDSDQDEELGPLFEIENPENLGLFPADLDIDNPADLDMIITLPTPGTSYPLRVVVMDNSGQSGHDAWEKKKTSLDDNFKKAGFLKGGKSRREIQDICWSNSPSLPFRYHDRNACLHTPACEEVGRDAGHRAGYAGPQDIGDWVCLPRGAMCDEISEVVRRNMDPLHGQSSEWPMLEEKWARLGAFELLTRSSNAEPLPQMDNKAPQLQEDLWETETDDHEVKKKVMSAFHDSTGGSAGWRIYEDRKGFTKGLRVTCFLCSPNKEEDKMCFAQAVVKFILHPKNDRYITDIPYTDFTNRLDFTPDTRCGNKGTQENEVRLQDTQENKKKKKKEVRLEEVRLVGSIIKMQDLQFEEVCKLEPKSIQVTSCVPKSEVPNAIDSIYCRVECQKDCNQCAEKCRLGASIRRRFLPEDYLSMVSHMETETNTADIMKTNGITLKKFLKEYDSMDGEIDTFKKIEEQTDDSTMNRFTNAKTKFEKRLEHACTQKSGVFDTEKNKICLYRSPKMVDKYYEKKKKHIDTYNPVEQGFLKASCQRKRGLRVLNGSPTGFFDPAGMTMTFTLSLSSLLCFLFYMVEILTPTANTWQIMGYILLGLGIVFSGLWLKNVWRKSKASGQRHRKLITLETVVDLISLIAWLYSLIITLSKWTPDDPGDLVLMKYGNTQKSIYGLLLIITGLFQGLKGKYVTFYKMFLDQEDRLLGSHVISQDDTEDADMTFLEYRVETMEHGDEHLTNDAVIQNDHQHGTSRMRANLLRAFNEARLGSRKPSSENPNSPPPSPSNSSNTGNATSNDEPRDFHTGLGEPCTSSSQPCNHMNSVRIILEALTIVLDFIQYNYASTPAVIKVNEMDRLKYRERLIAMSQKASNWCWIKEYDRRQSPEDPPPDLERDPLGIHLKCDQKAITLEEPEGEKDTPRKKRKWTLDDTFKFFSLPCQKEDDENKKLCETFKYYVLTGVARTVVESNFYRGELDIEQAAGRKFYGDTFARFVDGAKVQDNTLVCESLFNKAHLIFSEAPTKRTSISPIVLVVIFVSFAIGDLMLTAHDTWGATDSGFIQHIISSCLHVIIIIMYTYRDVSNDATPKKRNSTLRIIAHLGMFALFTIAALLDSTNSVKWVFFFCGSVVFWGIILSYVVYSMPKNKRDWYSKRFKGLFSKWTLRAKGGDFQSSNDETPKTMTQNPLHDKPPE